jgi:hypothetical protein
MGRDYVQGDLEYPAKTSRTSFRETVLEPRLKAAIPLVVVGSPALNISWRMILTLAGNHRHRRIVTDAGTETIPHLKKLSCAFGVPITDVVFRRGCHIHKRVWTAEATGIEQINGQRCAVPHREVLMRDRFERASGFETAQGKVQFHTG